MAKEALVSRLQDIKKLYSNLSVIEAKHGGLRLLGACHGRMNWPRYGVYFIYEEDEKRTTSGTGPRIVRVGTHALTENSNTTLWSRLRQHRGNQNDGGGNHRSSIFRLHVGTAILSSGWNGSGSDTWGIGGTADTNTRALEFDLEYTVSETIGAMKVLSLAVEDRFMRGFIERNAIALLSNYRYRNQPIDPASPNWLGRHCSHENVSSSGLWNVNHTEEDYDPAFLEQLKELINISTNSRDTLLN